MKMTEQELLRKPLAALREMWGANRVTPWPGKAIAANDLANVGMHTLPKTLPTTVTVESDSAKAMREASDKSAAHQQAQEADKFAPTAVDRLVRVEGDIQRAIDLGIQTQADAKRVEEAIAKSVSTGLDKLERDLSGRLSRVAEATTNLDTAHRADLERLRREIDQRVDSASVAAEVSAAVAAAFKPFADAVVAAGAEAVIGSMVQATIVRRATALDVFGVDVRDVKGTPVMVDVWDHPDAPAVDPHFIWTEGILRHLLLSQDEGESIWLAGDRGTGKTQSAMQFAGRTGRAFCRINFSKHTGTEDYLGATGLVNGQTVFEPKAFLSAYTSPSTILLLDEPTNACPGELAPLNALLEPGCAVNIGGMVWRRAAGVLVIAADNTATNGDASGRYAGTRAMNSALADRFSRIVQCHYLPRSMEVDALKRHTGCSTQLAEHVVDAIAVCRSKVDSGDIIDAPSIRSACAFIKALRRMPVADAWAATIAARQPAESAAGLAAVYIAAIDEQYIFDNI
jgi:cobaltochelatase CobS